MLSSLVGTTLGATIAGVAVALGGTAVVAYTAAVPPSTHQSLHVAVGTPTTEATETETPEPSDTSDSPETSGSDTSTDTSKGTSTATPVGPDATGPAAFGLCTAWSHHQSSPGASKDAVAFKNLATAAGGTGNIAAYCATVPHPGATAHPKPTTHTGATTHHTGKPSSHPKGKPNRLPATHGH